MNALSDLIRVNTHSSIRLQLGEKLIYIDPFRLEQSPHDADLILTEVYVEDEERQIESRVLYKYDAQGRVSQLSYNDHENNVFRREMYIYGENDNIFKTVVFNGKGDKVQEIRYEYDEHNEPVSSTLYDYYEDPNEPELTITLYEYRYDEEGNWVTRYEYVLDNDKKIPTYIVERDIRYF